ncbi:hypothetical protein DYB37_003212 [Aphanomyces astaci]|uniref:Uncharacterized protein n=1 Tax=Aphanomyces astaci TaxID=112090 RepID=A0A3R8DKW2_APHAT|nr:hypothetical protein DYB35_009940 [Aphanomyces astaci]RHZ25454.1 hypothetical protein DYB37_003212 [Aphanomyces astaci]RQM29176.1 hypothetical protein B5M09_011670 [Aphanomyces astaci]
MEEIVLTLVTRRGVVRPTICSDVEVATMVGRHGADFTDCKKVESLTWDTAGHYVANLIAVQVLLKILQTTSTHAVLGFAVVVNVTTDRYKIAQTSKTAYFSKDTMTLSTVCHLVPTLAKLLTIIPEQLSPQIYGMIDKNSFTSQHTSDD